MTNRFEKVEMKEDGCGLSELCPRCGNGYTVTSVSIAGQLMDICDLCANEIIDTINERPDRGGRLKPCPFCGGQTHVYETVNGGTRKLYWIECLECYAESPKSLDSPQDSIDAWNRRVKE